MPSDAIADPDPLRHQHAGHERARAAAEGEGGCGPDVPVIMITAYGDAETKRKALENGAEALLTKPIDFAALRGEIETRVGSRRVTRRDPRGRRRAGPRGAASCRNSAGRSATAPSASCSPATASRRWPLIASEPRYRHGGERHQHAAHGRAVAAAEAAGEREEQLSTIIVSAYGDMANIRTAMNRGAFDFLTKPIDFADLETTIAKTLRHVEVLREARRRQAAAERAHASLSRYFSPNLAERLAGDADGVDLAGQRREVASLFTDIAGFTTPGGDDRAGGARDAPQRISRRHDRHRVRARRHRGQDRRRCAARAVRRAGRSARSRRARRRLRARARRLLASASASAGAKKGVALGATRIGVHAGPAIVGNFGGGRFFDYTAYGDTINIAARLEAANKQLGTRICVSASAGEQGRRISAAGRSATSCCAARTEPLRAFEPLTRGAVRGPGDRELSARPSPSWKPAIPARSPRSPRRSASTRTTSSRAFI